MRYLFLTAVLICACTGAEQAGPWLGYDKPDWARLEQPYVNVHDDALYLVGKSGYRNNNEDYLEAKAGALMDILTQLAFFKGVAVASSINDFVTNDSGSQEITAKLTAAFDSAGLYQKSEWLADDGTLYVLCVYHSTNGEKSPEPETPPIFRRVPPRTDRYLFVGRAVSPRNNRKELSAIAEQDAKTQALLYLGGTANAAYSSYEYTAYEYTAGSEEKDFFEASLQCVSTADLSSLDFTEAERHIVQFDKRYYYYGLYTIAAAANTGGEIAGDYFSYSAAYSAASGQETELQKEINCNGNHFSRNQPYAVQNDSSRKSGLRHPAGITAMLKTAPENVFLETGIGDTHSPGVELANMAAASRAVISISTRIRGVLSQNAIRGLTKVYDEVTPDGVVWQVWELRVNEAAAAPAEEIAIDRMNAAIATEMESEAGKKLKASKQPVTDLIHEPLDAANEAGETKAEPVDWDMITPFKTAIEPETPPQLKNAKTRAMEALEHMNQMLEADNE